jgi:hypothetical protein
MQRSLSLLLAALAITSLAAQVQRFTVAIVRPDGRLVPFAAYEAGRWERAWPEADEATDVTTIENVPSVWRRRGDSVPDVWRAWPTSGGRPIDAKVSGLEAVKAHCFLQIALTTNLPEAKLEHPLKFGIAVDSSSVPVAVIEQVRRSDAIWTVAERVVLGNLPRLEAAQAANRSQLPRETPMPAAQITALYREAGSLQSPLYFVAEKKYRTPQSPRDPECNALIMMTGWLVPTDAGTHTLVDSRVFVTDCDMKEVRIGLPLAAFRVSGRVFWVVQEHGYEDETYVIAEIRETGIRYLVEVNGGGC